MIGLRRTCTHCKRRRKITAYWIDEVRLCQECSRIVAFSYGFNRLTFAINSSSIPTLAAPAMTL